MKAARTSSSRIAWNAFPNGDRTIRRRPAAATTSAVRITT
jgi:hypothetical protein